MFGAVVELDWMRPGCDRVARERRFFDRDAAEDSGSAIWRQLDALGVGCWNLSHMGGGCYAYEVSYAEGDAEGPYVLVNGGEVLSSLGDADDFMAGYVTVGLYPDGDSEGALFTCAFSLDGPPEKSIVEAVGFVLETCGVTASGIDWGKVAAVVAGGVCGWCDGGGFIDCVPPVRCSSCAAIATAAAMVERENRRSVLEFLELCGVGLEAFRADGFGAFVDAGATVSRWQAALSSGAFSVFDDCSDLGDVLAEAERVLGVTE